MNTVEFQEIVLNERNKILQRSPAAFAPKVGYNTSNSPIKVCCSNPTAWAVQQTSPRVLAFRAPPVQIESQFKTLASRAGVPYRWSIARSVLAFDCGISGCVSSLHMPPPSLQCPFLCAKNMSRVSCGTLKQRCARALRSRCLRYPAKLLTAFKFKFEI